MIPAERVRLLNAQPKHPKREWVLYWMTSLRRLVSNFALERAVDYARKFERPLLVLEPLRVGYPHANARLHTFVLEGMADNWRRAQTLPITYFPYVERAAGDGAGLLEALAQKACVVVGDDWPSFFIPGMQRAAAQRLDVCFEVVDSNGLFPMHATERVFSTAHSFRTHLQKVLPKHLMEMPREHPFEGVKLPTLHQSPVHKWKALGEKDFSDISALVSELPIDASVTPVAGFRGGTTAALERLAHFSKTALSDYANGRDQPNLDGTSALSPWFHFGHLSVHQAFATVMQRENWNIERLGKSIGGSRVGWWKCSLSTEAWLDQLVTWRELAFNMASHLPADYTRLSSLPDWAQQTISEHAKDKRPYLYTCKQLDQANTHDEVWNAAMRQLKQEGWFHNVLRMLWGKRIYEWSSTAEEALATMSTLMDRYSLDGRDPVSWSGYFWVLGRYDRAWGPKRNIFGSLRYISSARQFAKPAVKAYVQQYAPSPATPSRQRNLF